MHVVRTDAINRHSLCQQHVPEFFRRDVLLVTLVIHERVPVEQLEQVQPLDGQHVVSGDSPAEVGVVEERHAPGRDRSVGVVLDDLARALAVE